MENHKEIFVKWYKKHGHRKVTVNQLAITLGGCTAAVRTVHCLEGKKFYLTASGTYVTVVRKGDFDEVTYVISALCNDNGPFEII